MEKSNKGDAREQRLSGPQRMEHREREHVRKIMLVEARDKCHETRDAYVACAKGRTLSLPFMCRSVFKDFNECLKQYSSEELLDKRLAEYDFKPVPIDASIREGFKGDIFGTAKERGEQYRREAEAQALKDAARQRGTA